MSVTWAIIVRGLLERVMVEQKKRSTRVKQECLVLWRGHGLVGEWWVVDLFAE